MTVGLFLLSNLSPHTSTLEASAYMFVTGFGIGLVMQVLVVAVQNAVGYEELGVATSGNTLFRNIGSSVGTAIVGTIFATELASHLRADFPHASSAQLNTSHFSAATLAKLPPAIHETFLAAYANSLDTAFKVAGFVSIAAFISSWFIKQLPMRDTMTTEDLGSAFGAPRSGDSLSEILRALSVLVGRQQMRQWLDRVASDAGMDLPIADGWVLVQLRRDPAVDLRSLAASQKLSLSALDSAVADLIERGLLADAEPETSPAGGAGPPEAAEAEAVLSRCLAQPERRCGRRSTHRRRAQQARQSPRRVVPRAVSRTRTGPGPIRLRHRPGHACRGRSEGQPSFSRSGAVSPPPGTESPLEGPHGPDEVNRTDQTSWKRRHDRCDREAELCGRLLMGVSCDPSMARPAPPRADRSFVANRGDGR